MNFSCLIAGYIKDNPEQLRESLESLEIQTLPATEIIFVQDGELTEELLSILKEFSLKLPIKLVKIEENRGLGNALNVGLNACNYDLVVRMDTDDISSEERFEKQITFLIENSEISILGTWVKDIDEQGQIIGERTFPTTHKELYSIIWACPFAHPTVAFRKSQIEMIGSYRTDIKRRQDYDLWMRAAAHGLKFANLPEYLLYYRFTDEYYKKNNLKVAYEQAKMGWNGLRVLNIKNIYPYLAVSSPIVRALMPSFFEKRMHNLLRKIDPRKQK